jgi:hypothetical protein
MRQLWGLVLATIVVVTVFAAVLIVYKSPVAPSGSVDVKDIEPFLVHLQFLWDRYLDMVQLLVTLLTGVIAYSAGMVKFGQEKPIVNRGCFALGMSSLIFGLLCSLLWRIDSQILMEIELFGDGAKAQALYDLHGVHDPFTSSFEYASHSNALSHFAYSFMIGTAVGLLLGLASMSWFAYKNLQVADSRTKP